MLFGLVRTAKASLFRAKNHVGIFLTSPNGLNKFYHINMNGKGSKKRPTNLKKFLKNWDNIDWSKPSTKKDKMEYFIKKTQHVADAMEAESKRQRDQDANGWV
jgi:hypothetical protein